MPFNLTPNDKAITDSVLIKIDPSVPDVGERVLLFGSELKFQFPPLVKSDSKEVRWKEEVNTYHYEPQYHFIGPSPRKITLLIIYVVGGPPIGPGNIVADVRAVSDEVKKVKSYFWIGGLADGKLPVFQIKGLYDHVYDGEAAFRGKDISISYSDALVNDNGKIYPIKTEITLTLVHATNMLTDDQKAEKRHPNIPAKPQKEWY